ncbi:MAG TPA: ABC transporter ATP-binding protein [Atribacterota bacterium]|nr:ABC transporter ATP-binding protein [Atribacterota bacterium]HOR42351.1 ABC transporter ATP-binding protein [Atribacterota bacterium]
MSESILQVDNINCAYDNVPVIFGVSFEVKEKELVAIVGANGAGKSTIMKTIAGLLHPKKGTIRFKGQDISHLPANQVLRKGISYIPEGRRLFAKLSVEENLELGAYIEHNRSEIEQRKREVLTLFPILGERSRQIAETLSGGEQQMLAIARGLMSKPELLMLDELSLGLMPSLVESVMETILRIKEQGTTILLVEQKVQESLEIADRGYVIQTGKIVQSGSSEELLNSDEVKKAYLGM